MSHNKIIEKCAHLNFDMDAILHRYTTAYAREKMSRLDKKHRPTIFQYLNAIRYWS